MATITAAQVRELREMSGAPMMDCKKALDESGGNLDAATEWLRKKGIAKAAKKAGRDASEGQISSYIHHNGKVGVLLEVNCETDFVIKSDDFQNFCKDVSLHIASMGPRYLKRDEVPEALVAKEREVLAEMVDTSKPQEIQDKIIEGKLNKFFAETCLMEQPFVKDDSKTVEQLRAETVGVIGENLIIRRFARFDVGGE
ncbi:MAG: translation elongation factor Ts [Planctomycetota bacterium]